MQKNSAFIRTDKAIQQTFIRLLKKKKFEDITVQNILDETPTTRGTFYAHYKDKYEIAERMQQEFFEIEALAYAKTQNASDDTLSELFSTDFLENRELVEALLKIHTDTVDIEKALLSNLRQKYLDRVSSPYADIEADIYAHALLSLQLSFFHEPAAKPPAYHEIEEILMHVFLQLLHIDTENKRAVLRELIKC